MCSAFRPPSGRAARHPAIPTRCRGMMSRYKRGRRRDRPCAYSALRSSHAMSWEALPNSIECSRRSRAAARPEADWTRRVQVCRILPDANPWQWAPCRSSARSGAASGTHARRVKRDPAEHPGSVGAKDFKDAAAADRELTRIAPDLASSAEADSNRNCETLAWYGWWYSWFLLTTKSRFIGYLAIFLDSAPGTTLRPTGYAWRSHAETVRRSVSGEAERSESEDGLARQRAKPRRTWRTSAALFPIHNCQTTTRCRRPTWSGDPVFQRRLCSISTSLEYWMSRRSLSSGARSRDPLAGHDSGGDMIPHSRGAFCVRVMHRSRPLRSEGAGNAGCGPHPWPACNKKRRRQSPQARPEQPAFPARWLYGLCARSPRCTGLFSHRRLQARHPQAWSQRREIRTTRLRRTHQRRSSGGTNASIASRPQRPWRSRAVPLRGKRDGERHTGESGFCKSEIFSEKEAWQEFGKSARRANRWRENAVRSGGCLQFASASRANVNSWGIFVVAGRSAASFSHAPQSPGAVAARQLRRWFCCRAAHFHLRPFRAGRRIHVTAPVTFQKSRF